MREWRWRRFGFTQDLVTRLIAYQLNGCAICCTTFGENKTARPNADHCHDKMQPRGLLCGICNLTLGMYEKHQRPNGLWFGPYEDYLRNPPVITMNGTNP